MITRSLKFSLNEANSGKLKKLAELEQEYFRVVNLFIDHIFDRRGTETESLTEKYIRKLLFEQNKNASEIVLEDLKNLRKNKKGKWNRSVNRKFGYWFYRQALSRLNQLGEINNVYISLVDPRYTSQECPFCGVIDSSNRWNEVFKCEHCKSAKQDADFVGALNILSRQFGRELKVPDMTKTQRLQVVPVDR